MENQLPSPRMKAVLVKQQAEKRRKQEKNEANEQNSELTSKLGTVTFSFLTAKVKMPTLWIGFL